MSGVPLQVPPPSQLLYTDASLSGWGAHLLDLTASGVWSAEESSMHINVIEMKAVSLALAASLPQLSGQCVVLMSDNASVVSYLWHQGCTVSRALCHMASEIILRTELHSVCLSARFIPGRKNILANQLSRPDQVPTEWSFLLRVFEGIYSVLMCPHLDLCAIRTNTKIPRVCVPGAGPYDLEAGCIPASMGPSVCLCLPTICSTQAGSVQGSHLDWLLVDSGGFTVAPEGVFADLLPMLVDEPLELLQVWNLLVQPHLQKFHRGLGTLHLHA